jgi:phosphoribosylformimino-5-aminoimidazole carboxamide ribotide isomerase
MLTRDGKLDLRLGRAVPALDLMGGRVVRLRQGRYDRATAYPVEPLELARRYADAGAQWLHVVDLDAARSGERSPRTTRLLARLARVPGLHVQLGGGLRSGAQIAGALDLGVSRVVIGTLAAAEPELVGRLAAETGRVMVAVDCLDGRVRTHGWLSDTGTAASVFAERLAGVGVRDFLVTGIERDGTGRGPDLELVRSVRAAVPGVLHASGGVGSTADIEAAVAAGADAVVCGRSLLDGAIAFA